LPDLLPCSTTMPECSLWAMLFFVPETIGFLFRELDLPPPPYLFALYFAQNYVVIPPQALSLNPSKSSDRLGGFVRYGNGPSDPGSSIPYHGCDSSYVSLCETQCMR
jgi:hypothetical protein